VLHTDELLKVLDEPEINAKEVYEELAKHLRIKT